MHSALLASLIALASGAVDYSGSATLDDVTAFFNTDAFIILLVRSYTHRIRGHEPICIYNSKYTLLSKTSLIIHHHYVYYIKEHGYGFGYPVHYALSRQPGMDLAPLMWATNGTNFSRTEKTFSEDKNGRMYSFNYYDPETKCAVITFTDNSYSTKCELYVWKGSYGKPIENCRREYLYRCPEHTHYYPSESKRCPWSTINKITLTYVLPALYFLREPCLFRIFSTA
ncbi:uncharacterized protein LOC119397441 [Rhipicephalus sanguineus]|uniref:uncharacterized protein LOC119397441 n=1 Tax=Rhipicephalus sanguineus TaxID=34632 RepID=UPI0018945274|nr:uncharacterized protein LOC119397441 [Rhipicephalus sanguineus]